MTIFEHQDYRSYLLSYMKLLPRKGHGEARKIAALLNVSSTFVSHVLSGEKILTLEHAEELSEYLGHSPLEAEYFFYLVQSERAGTVKLKKFCRNKIEEIREKSKKLANRLQPKKSLSEDERAIFYSSPLYSAIHLYTSTHAKGRALDEIAERFEVTRLKAANIIEFLRSAGFINEDSGRYSMSTQSTHLPSDSPHLIRHHSNWRNRAIHYSEDLRPTELMYTGNVSLSRKDFDRLREEMVEFIKSFLKTVHDSPAEEIATLNLDFLWIRK